MDLQCSQISAPSAHCSRRAATPNTAPASSAEPMRFDNDWIGLLSFLFPFHHRDTGEDRVRSRVARHLRPAANSPTSADCALDMDQVLNRQAVQYRVL